MRLHKYILVVLFIGKSVFAQDFHFSQYFNSIANINPAYTGIINGDYRGNAVYKEQWKSISNSFKTIAASFDFAINKDNAERGYFGVGLNFMNDRAGTTQMQLSQLGIPVSYHLMLNGRSELSLGINSFVGQRSMKLDGVKWENQFDGVNHDPTILPGETFSNTQSTFFDIGAGLLWNYYFRDVSKADIGFSVNHLNKPVNSFASVPSAKTPMKYTFSAAFEHLIYEKKSLYLLPLVNISKQESQYECVGGILLKAKLGLESKYTNAFTSTALYGGMLYRLNDALVLYSRFDISTNISLGLSYDVNVSKLKIASSGRGSLEMSLMYRNYFQNDETIHRIPKYIF